MEVKLWQPQLIFRHLAKYCNHKIPCKACGKGHSHLLHQESGETKQNNVPKKESKGDTVMQSNSEEKLTK